MTFDIETFKMIPTHSRVSRLFFHQEAQKKRTLSDGGKIRGCFLTTLIKCLKGHKSVKQDQTLINIRKEQKYTQFQIMEGRCSDKVVFKFLITFQTSYIHPFLPFANVEDFYFFFETAAKAAAAFSLFCNFSKSSSKCSSDGGTTSIMSFTALNKSFEDVDLTL